LFVLNAGKALQTRDPGYVSGLVVGAWEQARGRGLIDPATERESDEGPVGAPRRGGN
jgi:hypothetical protein